MQIQNHSYSEAMFLTFKFGKDGKPCSDTSLFWLKRTN
jgi:hypothetical protein